MLYPSSRLTPPFIPLFSRIKWNYWLSLLSYTAGTRQQTELCKEKRIVLAAKQMLLSQTQLMFDSPMQEPSLEENVQAVAWS
jgi:hypothetical protein